MNQLLYWIARVYEEVVSQIIVCVVRGKNWVMSVNFLYLKVVNEHYL